MTLLKTLVEHYSEDGMPKNVYLTKPREIKKIVRVVVTPFPINVPPIYILTFYLICLLINLFPKKNFIFWTKYFTHNTTIPNEDLTKGICLL